MIHIQREPKFRNVNEAFFPVSMRPATCRGNQGTERILPGYCALYDDERDVPFTVVSRHYKLITNEDAYYMAEALARGVFGRHLEEFKCYNIHMPKTYGSCRIDLILPQSLFYPFGDAKESWTPFIRISNSYNRTIRLRYEIGFCRWICLNGVIFGKKGYSISFAHLNMEQDWHYKIEQFVKEVRSKLGPVDDMIKVFGKKLGELNTIPIPENMILPTFCKVFSIPDVDSEDVTPASRIKYLVQADSVKRAGASYYDELGDNAYAMMNVLTDFASFPVGHVSQTNIHSYQSKVGEWINELLEANKKVDFKLENFIGEEAISHAEKLEEAIPVDVQEYYPVQQRQQAIRWDY